MHDSNSAVIQQTVALLICPLESYYSSETVEVLRVSLSASFTQLVSNGPLSTDPLTFLLSPTAPPPPVIQDALKALTTDTGLHWPDWMLLLGHGNNILLSVTLDPGRITTATRDATTNEMRFKTIWDAKEMMSAHGNSGPDTRDSESGAQAVQHLDSAAIDHVTGTMVSTDFHGFQEEHTSCFVRPSAKEKQVEVPSFPATDAPQQQSVSPTSQPESARGGPRNEGGGRFKPEPSQKTLINPFEKLRKKQSESEVPQNVPVARSSTRFPNLLRTRNWNDESGELISLEGDSNDLIRGEPKAVESNSSISSTSGHALYDSSPNISTNTSYQIPHSAGPSSPHALNADSVGPGWPASAPAISSGLALYTQMMLSSQPQSPSPRYRFSSLSNIIPLRRTGTSESSIASTPTDLEAHASPRDLMTIATVVDADDFGTWGSFGTPMGDLWTSSRRSSCSNHTSPRHDTQSGEASGSFSYEHFLSYTDLRWKTVCCACRAQKLQCGGERPTCDRCFMRQQPCKYDMPVRQRAKTNDAEFKRRGKAPSAFNVVFDTSLKEEGYRYRRRGSSSSALSSGSSCFKERSSSSGSSDSNFDFHDDPSGCTPDEAAPEKHGLNLLEKISTRLHRAPRIEKDVKRLAKILADPEKSFASALEAVDRLISISETHPDRTLVTKKLHGGQPQSSQQIFNRLMRLTDVQATGPVLAKESTTARLLSILLEDEHSTMACLIGYLEQTPEDHGTAGIRFLLKRMSRGSPLFAMGSPEVLRLMQFATASRLKTDYHALRLVEFLFRTYPELRPSRPMSITPSLEQDGRTKLAALQVIRSSPGTCRWNLSEPLVPFVLKIIRDSTEDAEVRCMALSALAVLTKRSSTAPGENLIRLCISILLWQEDWQHCHKAIAAKWDVQKVMPHDDAYFILSVCLDANSSSILISVLREYFDFSRNETRILEALMALIVDHSVEGDDHWTRMLSVFVRSDLTSYLFSVISLPVPTDIAHTSYREITSAISDGLVGLMHCAEQLQSCKGVDPRVRDVLVALACDETMPMMVQQQAILALEAWDGIMSSGEVTHLLEQ
ncbi:hypothetical protein FRB95_007084 [Tulasnella sp. JGI-2019a]|nr:hypothetical protein FRB95_007084 [Tulasnella sp. JGI-2019a]